MQYKTTYFKRQNNKRYFATLLPTANREKYTAILSIPLLISKTTRDFPKEVTPRTNIAHHCAHVRNTTLPSLQSTALPHRTTVPRGGSRNKKTFRGRCAEDPNAHSNTKKMNPSGRATVLHHCPRETPIDNPLTSPWAFTYLSKQTPVANRTKPGAGRVYTHKLGYLTAHGIDA